MMGRNAAETEAAQLLGLLSANSGGGVKMGDGKNLFHADHGNPSSLSTAPDEGGSCHPSETGGRRRCAALVAVALWVPRNLPSASARPAAPAGGIA